MKKIKICRRVGCQNRSRREFKLSYTRNDEKTIYAFRFCSEKCKIIFKKQMDARNEVIRAKKAENDRGSKS